jgi:uncharacterized membrane protein YhaH (DUF805 family)
MSTFKDNYFSSKWKLSKKEYRKLALKWYILFFINFFSINIPIIVLIINIKNKSIIIPMLIIIIIQIILLVIQIYSWYCLNRKRANDLWYNSILTDMIGLYIKEWK